MDDNDLTMLIKSGRGRPDAPDLIAQWHRLNDEFIRKHVNQQDHKNKTREKIRGAKVLIEFLKTGDHYKEFQAKLQMKENAEKRSGPSGKMMDEKGNIEMLLDGMYLDPEKVTVDEYYSKKKQAEQRWQTRSKTTKSRTKTSSRR